MVLLFQRSTRSAWLLCLLLLGIAPARNAYSQLSTEDHLAEPGFWPTQDSASRSDFAGPESCGRCHMGKLKSQSGTPMALALKPASLAEILQQKPMVEFRSGEIDYRIETHGGSSRYSVRKGKEQISSPLTWAFGTGRVGQSYLFKSGNAEFHEARVTYFTSLHDLEFTPFRDLLSPANLEEAMQRPVGEAEVGRCFRCHATSATVGGTFDEAHLIPGITCEACHGPGAKHIQSMGAREATHGAEKTAIFNSGLLRPTEAVEFCGSCHGSWWDVKLAGVKGVSTARSAPFRLVTSKCWGEDGDSRLTCTTCHDPHEQLQTDAASYDKFCVSCHAGSGKSLTSRNHGTSPSQHGPACPVGTTRCTDCHMPKVVVPEMHGRFTDHRIRIVKAGEIFPD